MTEIDFQITNKCNMNCNFCMNAVTYQKDREIDELKNAIAYLKEFGLEKIHITGGEPLLYPELKLLLKEAKRIGLRIKLSTNGRLLEKEKSLLKWIDEIVLPFDSVSEETLLEFGRERNQLENTVGNISLVKSENPNTKIIIGTVLNKKNKGELKKLEVIMNLVPFDTWEIYQFLPHGTGKRNINRLLLDDREFNEEKRNLETSPIYSKIEMIPVSEMVGGKWILTPKLDFIKLKDDKPAFYGNLLEMSGRSLKDIVESTKQYVKK